MVPASLCSTLASMSHGSKLALENPSTLRVQTAPRWRSLAWPA